MIVLSSNTYWFIRDYLTFSSNKYSQPIKNIQLHFENPFIFVTIKKAQLEIFR